MQGCFSENYIILKFSNIGSKKVQILRLKLIIMIMLHWKRDLEGGYIRTFWISDFVLQDTKKISYHCY